LAQFVATPGVHLLFAELDGVDAALDGRLAYLDGRAISRERLLCHEIRSPLVGIHDWYSGVLREATYGP